MRGGSDRTIRMADFGDITPPVTRPATPIPLPESSMMGGRRVTGINIQIAIN